jgi:hypothetical protein
MQLAKGCFGILKVTPSLTTREESLIKVINKHPRANNSETKVNKVVPKDGTQGWVGLAYAQVQIEEAPPWLNLGVVEYWLESTTIEVKEKQLKVEYTQMFDGNPYNDKVHD